MLWPWPTLRLKFGTVTTWGIIVPALLSFSCRDCCRQTGVVTWNKPVLGAVTGKLELLKALKKEGRHHSSHHHKVRGFTVAGRALHGIAVMGVPGKEIMKGEKHMSLHFNSVWQLGTPREWCFKSIQFQGKGYSDRDVFLDFIVFLGEGKQTQSAPTPSARNCHFGSGGNMVFPEMKGATKKNFIKETLEKNTPYSTLIFEKKNHFNSHDSSYDSGWPTPKPITPWPCHFSSWVPLPHGAPMHFSPWNFHQQGIPARGIPWGAGIQLIKEQMARAAWRFSPGFSWKIDIQEVEAFQHLEGFFGGKLRNPGSGIFHQPEDVFRLLNSPSFFEKKSFPQHSDDLAKLESYFTHLPRFPWKFWAPIPETKTLPFGGSRSSFFHHLHFGGKTQTPPENAHLEPPRGLLTTWCSLFKKVMFSGFFAACLGGNTLANPPVSICELISSGFILLHQTSGFRKCHWHFCGSWNPTLTPWKINMEPENTPLEEENHLPNHHSQVLSMLIFRGVTKRSWKCWIDIMFTSFGPEQNGP